MYCAGKLIDAIPICDEHISIYDDYITYGNFSFNVTIPGSVGPSGSYYGISAQIFKPNGDESNRGGRYSVEIPSNIFNLTGATGNWSEYQLEDYTLWSADLIPCTSFACVKACVSNLTWVTEKDNSTTQYENCANSCPGVNISVGKSIGHSGLITSSATGQPTQATCTLARTSSSSVSTSVSEPALPPRLPHLRKLALRAYNVHLFGTSPVCCWSLDLHISLDTSDAKGFHTMSRAV